MCAAVALKDLESPCVQRAAQLAARMACRVAKLCMACRVPRVLQLDKAVAASDYDLVLRDVLDFNYKWGDLHACDDRLL